MDRTRWARVTALGAGVVLVLGGCSHLSPSGPFGHLAGCTGSPYVAVISGTTPLGRTAARPA